MQLVGHPRLYQKFVGHPRFVLGIYVTNILMSCGRCIAVKVGQTLIHSVRVLIQSDCTQEGQEEDGSATETPKPKRGPISPQIQLTVDKFKKQS